MSFAVCYACYILLKNSNANEESYPPVEQTYVHHKSVKGMKCSINSLRKKFKNSKRGGSSL